SPAPSPVPPTATPAPPPDCRVRKWTSQELLDKGRTVRFSNNSPCQDDVKTYVLLWFRRNSAVFNDQTVIEGVEINVKPGESKTLSVSPTSHCYQTDFYGEVALDDFLNHRVLFEPKDGDKPGWISPLASYVVPDSECNFAPP